VEDNTLMSPEDNTSILVDIVALKNLNQNESLQKTVTLEEKEQESKYKKKSVKLGYVIECIICCI
jgi:hypothetical protein